MFKNKENVTNASQGRGMGLSHMEGTVKKDVLSPKNQDFCLGYFPPINVGDFMPSVSKPSGSISTAEEKSKAATKEKDHCEQKSNTKSQSAHLVLKRMQEIKCGTCGKRVHRNEFKDVKAALYHHYLSKLQGNGIKGFKGVTDVMEMELDMCRVAYCKDCCKSFANFYDLLRHLNARAQGKHKVAQFPHAKQLEMIAETLTARDVSEALTDQGCAYDSDLASPQSEFSELMLCVNLSKDCLPEEPTTKSHKNNYTDIMKKLGLKNIRADLELYITNWYLRCKGTDSFDKELEERRSNCGFTCQERVELLLWGIPQDSPKAVPTMNRVFGYIRDSSGDNVETDDDDDDDKEGDEDDYNDEDDDDDDEYNDDDGEEDWLTDSEYDDFVVSAPIYYEPSDWLRKLQQRNIPVNQLNCGFCGKKYRSEGAGVTSPTEALRQHYIEKLEQLEQNHLRFTFMDSVPSLQCEVCRGRFGHIRDLLKHLATVSKDRSQHDVYYEKLVEPYLCTDIRNALKKSGDHKSFLDLHLLTDPDASFLKLFSEKPASGQASKASGKASGQAAMSSGQASMTSGQPNKASGQACKASDQASKASDQASKASGHAREDKRSCKACTEPVPAKKTESRSRRGILQQAKSNLLYSFAEMMDMITAPEPEESTPCHNPYTCPVEACRMCYEVRSQILSQVIENLEKNKTHGKLSPAASRGKKSYYESVD